ncbi:hypothetical protein H0H93_004145, partial [Arthromyces matolae]
GIQHQKLVAGDSKIEAHNSNVKKARTTLENATAKVHKIDQQLTTMASDDPRFQRLTTTLTSAKKSQAAAQKKVDKEMASVAQLKEEAHTPFSAVQWRHKSGAWYR